MSILLDALKKAAEERGELNEGSVASSSGTNDNKYLSDEKLSSTSPDIKSVDSSPLESPVVQNDSSNVDVNNLTDLSDSSLLYDYGSQELQSIKDIGRDDDPFSNKKVSEQIKKSKDNLYTLAELNAYPLFKVFLTVLAIPSLFFILVFYTSIKWFSILEADFESRFSNYNLKPLLDSYNLVNPERVLSSDDQGSVKAKLVKLQSIGIEAVRENKGSFAVDEFRNEVVSNQTSHRLDSNHPALVSKQNENKTALGTSDNFSPSPISYKPLSSSEHSIQAISTFNSTLNVNPTNKVFSLFDQKKYSSVLEYIQKNNIGINNESMFEVYAISSFKVYGPSRLNELVKMGLNNGTITNSLATLYFLSADEFLDLELVKKLNKLFPENPYGYILLSSFFLQNDIHKSLNILLSAANKMNDYYIYMNLAEIYKRIGDSENYQKYLALAINNEKKLVSDE